MKKTALIWLLMFIFLLGGCTGEQNKNFTVEQNGQSFWVDTQNQEIMDGTYVYQYYEEGGGIIIEYPNGATYYGVSNLNLEAAKGEGYDEDVYVPGDVLMAVVMNTPKEKNYVTAFIIAAAGVFTFISPKANGFFGGFLGGFLGGQGGETSKRALLLSRIGGVAIVLIAIGYMLA